MNPILKIGGKGLILCTGGVFSFNDEPIEIGLREDGSTDIMYKLRFVFQNEPKHGEGDFAIRAKPDEQCSEITIFNCNATSGAGVLSPLRIAANTSGEDLWLVFMITAWNGVRCKKIEYTVYKRRGDAHEPL